MKDQSRSSVFLKGFVFVLAASLAITYVWMYVQGRRSQSDVSSTDLQVLQANYEREKAAVEGYIARADQALADLDSQRGTLTEPNLDGCYRIKYAPGGASEPGEPYQPPVEVSRELDPQCADKAYEIGKNFALRRQEESAAKTTEVTSTKGDLEQHLNEVRSKFNADRVRILTEAQRAQSKDSFITKFPIVFSLISLLTVAGIYCTEVAQRPKRL